MTFEKTVTFKPRLQVLNQEQMWSIHNAALEILKTTGFQMKHSVARDMLLEAGCNLSRNGRIRLPPPIGRGRAELSPQAHCAL